MLSALVLAASIASCTVENARYGLRGAPGVTARFYTVQSTPDWPTGLALGVRVAKTGRSYWFLPWQGGTDQKTNLAWVRESNSPARLQPVRRDMEMFATDASYNLHAQVPRLHEIAPVHMLLPGLSHLAWYSTTDVHRDSLPRAFFDLTGCEASGRTEPAPRIEFPAVP